MNAPPRRRRFSWIASPMLAWGLHFATVYSLQGLGCARGWGDAATRLAMGAATVLALVAVGWIGLRAWRRLRTLAGTRDGTFAARLVAILSLLAAVAIGFTALPMFLLLPCE